MGEFRIARFGTCALLLSAALASCSSDDKQIAMGQASADAGSAGEAGVGGNLSPGSLAGQSAGGSAELETPGGSAGAIDRESDGGAAGRASDESAGAGGTSQTPPLTELSCTDAAALPTYPGGISIRLLNATTAPLYFGKTTVACGYDFGVTMESADHTPLKAFLDDCDHSCVSLQHENGCACQEECVQIVTKVDPGKYYEVGWTGTVFESVSMPTSCYQDQSCGTDACWHEVLAETPVTFSADLYSDKTCSTATCYDCTTGSTGTCTVTGGSTVAGTKHSASLSWTGDKIAVLTFN